MGRTVGLNTVLKNIDNVEDNVLKNLYSGMDYGCRDAVNYIKKEYADSREHTGHGFTSRTHNLQNSINSQPFVVERSVIGVIFADMSYAPYVEFKYEGQYAYLWPGANDKKGDIVKAIIKFVKVV